MEDRVTVAAPDGAVAQYDIQSTGARYKARGGGLYDVPPRVAKLILEDGGFRPNVGGAVSRAGLRCPVCGFGSYFARCSRCGTDRRMMSVVVTVDRLPEAQASIGERYTALRTLAERRERA